jgi:hypothetical protein
MPLQAVIAVLMQERAQHQAECDAIAAAGDAQLAAVAAANKAAAEQQTMTVNSMAALQAELAAAKRDAQVSNNLHLQ